MIPYAVIPVSCPSFSYSTGAMKFKRYRTVLVGSYPCRGSTATAIPEAHRQLGCCLSHVHIIACGAAEKARSWGEVIATRILLRVQGSEGVSPTKPCSLKAHLT